MTDTLYYGYFDSEIGELLLVKTDRGLCIVDNVPLEEVQKSPWYRRYFETFETVENEEALASEWQEIEEYLAGDRQSFSIQTDVYGTAFEKSVWQVLNVIPYGQTFTYGEVARMIGKRPNVAQAVGQAIGSNPLMIVVPCHRVISQTGELTGYRGGIEMKAELLDLEGINLN